MSFSTLPQLLILLLFAFLCAVLADKKGRSPMAWFFIGLFFHVLGLILLAVLPDRKKERERHVSLLEENRRLRERLRHDRSVADRRHGDVERRLRAHDVALGLDTIPERPSERLEGRRAPELREGAAPVGVGGVPGAGGSDRVWYFSNDARSRSAAPVEQLVSLYHDGRIGGQTLVWTAGMADWRRLADVPDLMEAMRG